jgi:uncharacterized membrane protein YphA (DoxX/SURF4 family)
MSSVFRFFFSPSTGPGGIFLIRLAVGLIFLTQGILKFSDPNMGVVRCTRIGFSHPSFTVHFAGTFEIVCGVLVLVGLWTRAASVALSRLRLSRSKSRNSRGRDKASGTW